MGNWWGQNRWPWEKDIGENAGVPLPGGTWYPGGKTDKPKTGTQVPQTYEELMKRNLPYRTKKIQVESMFPDRYEEFVMKYGTAADRMAFREEVKKEVEKASGADLETLRKEAEKKEAEQQTYEREQNRLERLDRLAAQKFKEEQDRLDREFKTAQAEAEKTRNMTPAEKMVYDFEKKQAEESRLSQETQLQWERGQREKEWQQEQRWQEAQSGYQQQQLEWSQEQFRLQQEAEKKSRLAALAAQPASWLQYAAEANQAPVMQPWMQPLMPSDYEGLKVGEEIPGWSATNMSEMPGLTTPSAQLQARMGPTALRQLYAYKQARTGQTPEESQFRLWSGAPPSDRFGGYSRGRQSWA